MAPVHYPALLLSTFIHAIGAAATGGKLLLDYDNYFRTQTVK